MDAPANEPSAETVDATTHTLREAGVRAVVLSFVDNAGITRVKLVPLQRLGQAARTGVGASSLFGVFAVDDHLAEAPGLETPSGDSRLLPVLQRMVPLAALPGFAWAPAVSLAHDGSPEPAAARACLERSESRAAEAALTFSMAFEVEFSVLDAGGAPLHRGPGFSATALLPGAAFVTDLLDALERQGVPVEQIHPEYADGQYEISVAPATPMAAVDRYVLLRLTARQVAHRHGLQVSFSPLVLPGAVGNGCHLHMSAAREGRNLLAGGDGAASLTTEGEHLVAGVLRRLPECTAIYAPSTPSYARLQPGHWAGAYACWGLENREAAVRLVHGLPGARASSANIELKPVDGSANPYLAAAVMVASALEGLADDLPLAPGTTADPQTLNATARKHHAVVRLPPHLGAATAALRASSFARETLGPMLHDAFCAVRAYEWERYGTAPEAELIAAHLLRHG